MTAVVCLSGGMDSATLIPYAKNYHDDVESIGFNYGSKHNKWELPMAAELAGHYGIPFQVIDLLFVNKLYKSNLLSSGEDIPEGHYESPEMAQTIVPGRNLLMASILIGYLQSRGGGTFLMGMHAGDEAIYPDCRADFVTTLQKTITSSMDGTEVFIEAPFLTMTKKLILQYGYNQGVPYELTRTCYQDQPIACGRCGACTERREAFAMIDRKDPLDYEGIG